MRFWCYHHIWPGGPLCPLFCPHIWFLRSFIELLRTYCDPSTTLVRAYPEAIPENPRLHGFLGVSSLIFTECVWRADEAFRQPAGRGGYVCLAGMRKSADSLARAARM